MKAYCQETFRWIHFGRLEALNSISLWRGKNFLAINFLKQESWKQRAETGESENFAFGMPMELKYRSAEMGLDLCQIQPYTST